MPEEEILECNSNAEECRRNALAASDEEAKIHWLQLARDWQSLAKTGRAMSIH